MEYTNIERILSKFKRELKTASLDEGDAIEWIGEAMEFLTVAKTLENLMEYKEVVNYHCDIPDNTVSILQIAKDKDYVDTQINYCQDEAETEDTTSTGENPYCSGDTHPANLAGYPVPLDCQGNFLMDVDVSYFRPFTDLEYWYDIGGLGIDKSSRFTPVRLTNKMFFSEPVIDTMYRDTPYEYSIIERKKLRFNFKDGWVLVAFKSLPLDERGYPLIPDNISYITAITYYIKWRIAEYHFWNGREHFSTIVEKMDKQWRYYAGQAKNSEKMPTVDELENISRYTKQPIKDTGYKKFE